MKITTQPEAYCAEMNCDWQGDVPAIAKCPLCGSNQVRRIPGSETRAMNITRSVRHSAFDEQGRCSYSLFWMADYYPGHPKGENRVHERGQCFFGVPPRGLIFDEVRP